MFPVSKRFRLVVLSLSPSSSLLHVYFFFSLSGFVLCCVVALLFRRFLFLLHVLFLFLISISNALADIFYFLPSALPPSHIPPRCSLFFHPFLHLHMSCLFFYRSFFALSRVVTFLPSVCRGTHALPLPWLALSHQMLSLPFSHHLFPHLDLSFSFPWLNYHRPSVLFLAFSPAFSLLLLPLLVQTPP